MKQQLDKLVEQVRKQPELTTKAVRNEAIKRDYWEGVRSGKGYCQAADDTARKYEVAHSTVYRARDLKTKTITKIIQNEETK